MPIYRLFYKNSEGRTTASEDLDFETDEEAIEYARKKHAAADCEIWCTGEMIADLKRGVSN